MYTFLWRHKRFVVSLAYAVICAAMLFPLSRWQAEVAWMDHVRGATRVYQEENREAKRELDVLRAISTANENLSPVDMSTFLDRLSGVAANTGLQVYGLMPVGTNDQPSRLSIELVGSYESLIRLLAGLESYRVPIRDLRLRRDEEGAETGEHSIALVVNRMVEPRALSTPEKEVYRELMAVSSVRDPLARPLHLASDRRIVTESDLTWVYKMSAIRQGSAGRQALINGRAYSIGDQLAGMMIADITDDTVYLVEESADGPRRHHIMFRPGIRK